MSILAHLSRLKLTETTFSRILSAKTAIGGLARSLQGLLSFEAGPSHWSRAIHLRASSVKQVFVSHCTKALAAKLDVNVTGLTTNGFFA
jgi:hypothetical protein